MPNVNISSLTPSLTAFDQFMVDTKALAEGKDKLITERARQFIEIVKAARG